MKKLIILALSFAVIGCGKKEEAAKEFPATNNSINSGTAQQTPAPANPRTANIRSGDTIITPSDLKIIVIKEGKGVAPKVGQTVSAMYTGKLLDGTAFDSNQDPKFHHTEPLKFPVGVGRVIPGWDEGFMNMNVGGKYKLIIPSRLAYGSQPPQGSNIPVDAVLVFDVELIGAE